MAVLGGPSWVDSWDIALYAVLLVALILGGIGLHTRRLRRHAVELSGMVREQTRQLVEEKRTVEDQAERLARLEQMKDRFFANVSHEFHTPLTLILGPVDDLLSTKEEWTKSLVEDQLLVIRRSARRLQWLVDQLLDVSRLEIGGLHLRPRRIDLVVLVRELVAWFSPLAERRGITLTHHCMPPQLMAIVDSGKVEKVVAALVANALKSTPNQGHVDVRLFVPEEEPRTVEIRVRDTGRGIPEDELKNIFDRFYQASNACGMGAVGTGIRLALARECVELHGGSIRVESEPGFGSTFMVRLPLDLEWPLVDPQADAAEGGGPEALQKGDEEGSDVEWARGTAGSIESGDWEDRSEAPQAKVLVVEHNEALRRYIHRHLEKRYRVEEAVDGVEGLIRARVILPDLILADAILPQRDGKELCRLLKADATLGHVPVVLLTAEGTEEAKGEGLTAGADATIVMPFSASELESRVENLIAIGRDLAARFSWSTGIPSGDVGIRPEDAELLFRIQEAVLRHLADEHFTIECLADQMALGVRQLQRRVNELTGLTPSRYMRMLRLERAADMLRSGVRPIKQVSSRVGYADANYFSKLFHQAFGVPPSAYGSRKRAT